MTISGSTQPLRQVSTSPTKNEMPEVAVLIMQVPQYTSKSPTTSSAAERSADLTPFQTEQERLLTTLPPRFCVYLTLLTKMLNNIPLNSPVHNYVHCNVARQRYCI